MSDPTAPAEAITAKPDLGREERIDVAASHDGLKSLESLRIIAALLVVCAHIPPYNLPFFGQFFGATRFLGSIGVDLFFVISGVVIGLSTVRAVTGNVDRPLQKFLIARIFRIYPLYWTVTIITIFLIWRKGLSLPTWNELAHSLLLVPRMEGNVYSDPIMHLGWTLQFEVFFYALCALAILFRSKWLPLILAVAFAIASLAFDGYYLNPILLEFAGGYVLALYLTFHHQPIRRIGPIKTSSLVAAATILLLFAATGRDGGYPESFDVGRAPRMVIAFGEIYIPRWIAWGLPAFFVVAAAIRLETSLRWRLAPLGKYTYSVYLCHTFAIAGSLAVARRFGPDEGMVFVLPVCIFFITSITYRLIENPMIRVGKRLNRGLRILAAKS